MPTNKWVVFGHHFAAIAGPGPLVGPVLAAQFGYLPGMLWLLVGATLGGGVHDAIVMFASIRRGGKSLGQMLKEEVNPVVGFVAMISVLAIMTILLLAVLGLVVVKALAESPWGLFAIAMTIPLAFIMGVGHTIFKVSVRNVTIFGIVGLLVGVWAGSKLNAWGIEHYFEQKGEWVAWAIMIYGFAASVLPVWMLLAPRDYLSTFMNLAVTLALLMSATFSAGWIKIFDEDPRLGFIAQAKLYAGKLAAGGTAGQLNEWAHLRFNGQVNTVVTAFFLLAVAFIFLGCAREWVLLLRGQKKSVLHEDPLCPQ